MHQRAAAFAERAETEHGFAVDVHEFPAGTKTASDAAAAIGCDVAQIASSLVFAAPDPVVVVTSGANRVSEAKLATVLGADESTVAMADADVVRESVGWSIGGVPPFCHDSPIPVYMDDTLQAFDTVWAAAGTPEAVFPIAPERLRELADARPADVTA
jgi:prolyl-tRNA editing enzyme YbaK/EbsC (Cys-tRNA(Pro) deacylase)